MPIRTKAIKHSIQFKTVNIIQRILNKGGYSVEAFTQAAIAQEITIGPFNAAPIAAVDLIGKKLGSLILKSATSPDEIKARKDALQDALLQVLDRLSPNGREQCASLIAKEAYNILKELVTIPGKLNVWAGSKGIRAPFDPKKHCT